MVILEKLRNANPGLELYSVFDAEFTAYGKILALGDCAELASALEKMPIPEVGNSYTASCEILEAPEITARIRRAAFAQMPIQAGCCNGHGHMLNSFEYHKCSEVNFTTTGLVLLLALPAELDNGNISSGCVKGFYLPPNVIIELYPRTLHFAPCRISDSGFNCLVVLEKGVNFPLDRVDTNAAGEEKLLWMVGKWLTCHKDSPQAKLGAYIGISGENIDLHI